MSRESWTAMSLSPNIKTKSLLIWPLKGQSFGNAKSDEDSYNRKVLHYNRRYWTKPEANGKTSVITWDCFDLECRYGSWVKTSVSFRNEEIDKLVELAVEQKEGHVYTKAKDKIAAVYNSSSINELENNVVFSSMTAESGTAIKLTMQEVQELGNAMEVANKVKTFRKVEKGSEDGVEPSVIRDLMHYAAAHAMWGQLSAAIMSECPACNMVEGQEYDDSIGHSCESYNGSNLFTDKDWIKKILTDEATDKAIKTSIRLVFALLDISSQEQTYLMRSHYADVKASPITQGQISDLCNGKGGWRAEFVRKLEAMDRVAKIDEERKKRKQVEKATSGSAQGSKRARPELVGDVQRD